MANPPSNESIHKMVSLRVLEYVPVKPESPEKLDWPLRFMTTNCKAASKIKSNEYTNTEYKVSSKILDTKDRLDRKVRREIMELGYEEDENGNSFIPPLVLRAESGLGKSILIGKVVSELISAAFSDEESDWPKYNRIVYSQLKDKSKGQLESSICKGMDTYHQCLRLEQFFSKTKHLEKKIIFIDSLDEHEDRSSWWDVTNKLSNEGWTVVWACRDPDWDHHSLGNDQKINLPKYKPKDGEKKHWDRLTNLTWKLDIDEGEVGDEDRRMTKLYAEVSKYEKDHPNNNSTKVKEYIDYCYSETQLMHIYFTNSAIKRKTSNELDTNLVNLILSSRLEFDKDTTGIDNEDIFGRKDFYNRFFKYNLAKLIIDASLRTLKTRDVDFDVHEVWKKLCKDFYQKQYSNRPDGVLEEEIQIKPEYYDGPQQDLLRWLHLTGITRDYNHFRHRDFAVIAFVEGCERGLQGLEENNDHKDILFKHFFPMPNPSSDSLNHNSKKNIYDFLRRTGNIIAHSDYLWNLEENPKSLILKLAKEELSSGITGSKSSYYQKALSISQSNAIKSGANSRSVILHGVPGSGKTYGGIERILWRQKNAYSQTGEGSRVLIVALTKQLATSINSSLYREHIDSKFFDFIYDDNGEKEGRKIIEERIFSKFDIMTFSDVIEDWLPDGSFSENWIMDFESLFLRFKNTNSEVAEEHHRPLQFDFQNRMFDKSSGKLIDKHDYLEFRDHRIPRKVLEKWHDKVRNEREDGKIALVEACIILRNLLLKFEHKNKNYPDELFNPKYELNDAPTSFKIDEHECFKKFEKRFQQGDYDCIMVDEVQDLPHMAVIMLSCLSPIREPNRFIIAGDELQTLNGQEFHWNEYLESLDFIVKVLGEELVHIHTSNGMLYNHHLTGLIGHDMEKVDDHHLNENWRNHQAISDIAVQSWMKWPDSEYWKKDKYPLADMKAMREKSKETSKFSPFMVIETTELNFKERITETLEFLNSRSKVSLLFANDKIRGYVKKEIMAKDKQGTRKVESFTPWTIKGLERDAVVIIGAYTAHEHDADTSVLVRRGSSNGGSLVKDIKKQAIDLLRRKMIVSLTRAKEQLILIESPTENFNLGTNEYRFTSLNPPQFTAHGYKTIRVAPEDKLLQKLTDFFKEAGITDDGFSIVRISEGLSIIERARNEDEMEKEYIYYQDSLNTVLSKDIEVENSILFNLMFNILELTERCPLQDLTILKDLMILKTEGRSYIDNPPPHIKIRNTLSPRLTAYSKMVKESLAFRKSSGSWSGEGFKLAYSTIEFYFGLKNRIQNKLNNLSIEYAHYADITPDISAVLNGLKSLLSDFSDSLGLPREQPLDEGELLTYLFTNENELINSDYSLVDEDFVYSILSSLQGAIRVDREMNLKGRYNNNFVNVDLSIWKEFWKDLYEFEFLKKKENIQILRTFSAHFIDLFANKPDSSQSHSSNTEYTDYNQIGASSYLPYCVGFMASLRDTSLLQSRNKFLRNYIINGFQFMDDPMISQLLLDIKETDTGIGLLDSIDDRTVLKWRRFEHFILFAKFLSETPLPAFQERGRNLYAKSSHLDDWINQFIQTLDINNSDPEFDENGVPARSIYTAAVFMEEQLRKKEKHEYAKTKFNYETMIYQIILLLRKNQEDGNSILLDEKLLKNWRSVNIIFNLMSKSNTPFMDEYQQGIKQRGDIFSLLPNQDTEAHINDLYNHLDKTLIKLNFGDIQNNDERPFGENVNKTLKDLILEILYLQTQIENNQELKIKPSQLIERFPVLQQTGLFNMGFITEMPQHFAPKFNSTIEEVSWRNTNKKQTYFESQKDKLQQMDIVSGMFKMWDVQNQLFRIFYSHNAPQGSEKLFWRFDGFGKRIPFETWMMKNNKLFKEKTNQFSHHLLDGNLEDFSERLNAYLKIINASLEVLQIDSQLIKQKTSGLKVLIEKIISKVFDLKSLWATEYSQAALQKILLSIFPNGDCIQLDIRKTGSIASKLNGVERSDLAWILSNFGLDYNKFTISEAIESLLEHQELFHAYLDQIKNQKMKSMQKEEQKARRQQQEMLEHIDANQNHGLVILDDEMRNYLGEIAKQQIEKGTVYTQEQWDEYYESLSEEEKAQIEIIEESDDFIDDSEVKSRLQISDEKWNSFSETEKEQARELYERLK